MNPKKRGEAREEIVNAAVTYSKSETIEAKKRVARIICACIDIVRYFYGQKISKSDYILASEVADTIIGETKEIVITAEDKISNKLDKQTELLISAINKPQNTLNSAVQLVRDGNLKKVNGGLQSIFKHISAEHPLFPDYGFNWKSNGLVSEPLTKDALKKYPPRYLLKGAIHSGGQYFNNPDLDLADYAYRHQLTLTIDIDEAKKYLGDIEDPAQFETIDLIGKKLYAKPPAFPPAFPCSIKIKETTLIEYVLMRTQEILDDGTYVFSNKEQTGSHLYFEFRVKVTEVNHLLDVPASTGKTDFSISVKDATTEELIKFSRFMSAVQKEKEISLYVLDSRCNMLTGYIDNVNYKTGFRSVEEEIDFLERVNDIEKHFKVSMAINGEISSEEYQAVIDISELVRKEIVEGTWSTVTCHGIVDDNFREKLKEMENEMETISYVGMLCVDLFGAKFEFKHMRTFKSVVMKDYDKLKKITDLLDNGESIKITFISGKDNTVTDTIHVPDDMKML